MHRPVLIFAVALAAMLAIGADLSGRLHSPSYRMAQAIEVGYGRSATPDGAGPQRGP
jgi:hypothetical protein